MQHTKLYGLTLLQICPGDLCIFVWFGIALQLAVNIVTFLPANFALIVSFMECYGRNAKFFRGAFHQFHIIAQLTKKEGLHFTRRLLSKPIDT